MKKWEIDALLRRIASGDNAAFEKLYAETKRGVYSFLFSYFNDRQDCEDAMQTVYLKIKTNISQYAAGSNGLAWILQIAKNTALNEIRAKANYRKLKYGNDEKPDGIEAVELRDILTKAMKSALNEEEQRIVVLHVIWKYRHREIAKIIDCPVGTVTSKYKRAVDKLKTALKEEWQ